MTRGSTVDYNPYTADFYTSDPVSVYRWMRDEAPVYHSERWGWYALTRFEDVRAAAIDADTFRSFEGMDIDDTGKEQKAPGSLPDMDNPRHDEIRRIVQPFFLPRRIAKLQDGIRLVVRDLIAPWRDRGEVDLAQELAWPMPFDVFFQLVGLPGRRDENPEQVARRELLEEWTNDLHGRIPGTPHLTPEAKAATAKIQRYYIDMLEERRRNPQDDLVSRLVNAHINGVPFVDGEITPTSEISGLMMVLFLGGVDSTAGLTTSLFKLLAENPDQRALLQRDPSLIPAAIEETLRCSPPLQLTARTTARDVTRGRFRHMGFGEGVHGCLGAPLARLEATTAVQEALPVLGDYELSGPPVFCPSSPNMFVWNNVPVTFPITA